MFFEPFGDSYGSEQPFFDYDESVNGNRVFLRHQTIKKLMSFYDTASSLNTDDASTSKSLNATDQHNKSDVLERNKNVEVNNETIVFGNRSRASSNDEDNFELDINQIDQRRHVDICQFCSLAWDTADAQDGGTPSNMSIQALGSGSRFFHRRTFQARICYNPRPFSKMSEKALTSYKRLATVFECNWTVLEPLAVCVGDSHPVIANAIQRKLKARHRKIAPGNSWFPLLCGAQNPTCLSRSASVEPLGRPNTCVTRRRRKHLFRRSAQSLSEERRQESGSLKCEAPWCSNVSHEISDSLEENQQSESKQLNGAEANCFRLAKICSHSSTTANDTLFYPPTKPHETNTFSALDNLSAYLSSEQARTNHTHGSQETTKCSFPEGKCEVPGYLSYFIGPFLLESQRCDVRQISTPCPKKLYIARGSQRYHSHTQLTSNPCSPIKTAFRNPNSNELSIADYSFPLNNYHHQASFLPSTRCMEFAKFSQMEEMDITPGSSFLESKVMIDGNDSDCEALSRYTSAVSSNKLNETKDDTPVNHSSNTPSVPIISSSALHQRTLPPKSADTEHCDSLGVSVTSNNSVFESNATEPPNGRKEFKKRNSRIRYRDSAHAARLYVHEQSKFLKLYGCAFPKDVLVIFVAISPFIRQHLQIPITQRRRLDLQYSSSSIKFEKKPKVLRTGDAISGREKQAINYGDKKQQDKSVLCSSHVQSTRRDPYTYHKKNSTQLPSNCSSEGTSSTCISKCRLLRRPEYNKDWHFDSSFNENTGAFERLVKGKRDCYPLLIRSFRLKNKYLLPSSHSGGNELDPFSRVDVNRNKMEGNGTVALIVLLGGKDMVSLDWLPFISHFFNFLVGDRIARIRKETAKQKRTVENNQKVKRSIDPLIPLPPFLFNSHGSKSEQRTALDETHTDNKCLGKSCSCSQLDNCHNKVVYDSQQEPVEFLLAEESSLKTEVHLRGDEIRCGIRCGFVVVEYPGSGSSCGPPSVQSIIEAATNSVNAAINRLIEQVNPKEIDIRVVGYSLGAAVAIAVAAQLAKAIVRQERAKRDGIFSSPVLDSCYVGCDSTEGPIISLSPSVSFKLSRTVLIAPFTSVSDWAASFLGVPQTLRKITNGILEGFVEPNIFWNNLSLMRLLCDAINSDRSSFSGFRLVVLHGGNDTTVPFSMGLQLATLAYQLLHRIEKGTFEPFYPILKKDIVIGPKVLSMQEQISLNSVEKARKERKSGEASYVNDCELEDIERPCTPTSQSPLVLQFFRLASKYGIEDNLEVNGVEHSELVDYFQRTSSPKNSTSSSTRNSCQMQPSKTREQIYLRNKNQYSPKKKSSSPIQGERPIAFRHTFNMDSDYKLESVNNHQKGTANNAHDQVSVYSKTHQMPHRSGVEDSINVEFFELLGDHQSILADPPQQLAIFKCFFSEWMTCSIQDV